MPIDQDHLAEAIRTSLDWYLDIHALHGIETATSDGLWRTLGRALPWHSTLKTLRPDVSTKAVLSAYSRVIDGSIADSYGLLDLGNHGFDLLFEAQWLRLAPDAPVNATSIGDLRWVPIRTVGQLVTWTRIHDYAEVLVPDVLRQPRFTVLGCFEGTDLIGGAVLHQAGSATGLSNLWSQEARGVDLVELIAVARSMNPAGALCAYASGAELTTLTDLGFTTLGPHRVWIGR